MQAFAALCMLVVGLVTMAVGVRLLWLWRRTREVPELCFGLGFLTGSLGTAGAQLGQRLWWTEPGSFAAWMNGTCFVMMVVGTIALFVGIWRIFRPDRSWAAALAAVASLLTIATFALRWSGGDFPVARIESPGILLFHSLRVVLFVWSALEAFLYYAMLRKRIPLGLADPVVAGQIGLWGVAGSVMAGISAFIIVCIFVVQRHPLDMAGWTALLSLGGIVVSVAMWCAFFPPQRLRAWLAAPTAA